MRTPFGQRLYDARKKRGLTQARVASAAGMSQSTYSALEKSGAGSANVVQLAEALGISPSWLATGADENSPFKAPAAQSHGDLTFTAIELARLFDKIPPEDTVARAVAYSAATNAILAVMRGEYGNPASSSPTPFLTAEKQP